MFRLALCIISKKNSVTVQNGADIKHMQVVLRCVPPGKYRVAHRSTYCIRHNKRTIFFKNIGPLKNVKESILITMHQNFFL